MAVGMIKRCPACMRGYDSGKDSLVCPHCHAWLKERAALGFCPFCGHDLHVGKYCGRALPPPSFDMCICTGLPQIESPGADAQIVVLDPPKVRERPAWDEIWMEFAERLAQRSTCARASVGCVVVSADNSIVLGLGYNGGPKGLSNACLSEEPGKCGHLHAEINALIKTNYRDAAPKKVYLTMEPCYTCAVALVNAGVREVIFKSEYRDHTGTALLSSAGVQVRRFPEAGVPARDPYLGQDRKD